METPVEIRYRGVVVGSATEILRAPGNDAGLFLVVPDPLPVGTVVKLGEADWGRVEKVVESADPRGAGMYVRLVTEAETREAWVPQLPEMIPLPPPRRSPTPPGVPLVSPRVAEARPRLGDNGERRPTIAGHVPPPVAPERSGGIVLATPDRPPAAPLPERPPTIVVSPLVESASAPEPEAPRERRNTLVVAIPPPATDYSGPTIASAKASGEFQSRIPTPAEGQGPRLPQTSASPVPATIVIAPDPLEARDGTVTAPMENPPSEEFTPTPTPAPDEPSINSLQPARPLPVPDGRRKTSRRRRNTRT